MRTKAVCLLLVGALLCTGCTAGWRVMGVDVSPARPMTMATADPHSTETQDFPLIIGLIVAVAMGFGVYAASG